jgi:hypothetical protein
MSCSHEDRDVSVVYNDPTVVKDDHDFPWKSSGENVDDTDHHSQVEEEQQESHGLEHKDWLALQGNSAGEKPDFYNFWKGEGDYHTIQHAQGKELYLIEIFTCLFSSYANIRQHINFHFHSSFIQMFCDNLAKLTSMFWRSFGVYDVPYTHRRSI